MKRAFLAAILTTGMAVAQTSDPPGFHFWSHADIVSMSDALAPQMDAHKFKSQTIAPAGNHRFLIVHREGPGEAEYHATESDVIFVESGEATLVWGGRLVNPRTTAPNEMRGPGIEGGTERKVAPGDVIAIPPRLPHQMKAEGGKKFNYFVVKVTEEKGE